MSRYTSNVIEIGDLKVGGHYPIRIQSMTNTNTLDTLSTVLQIIQLADAGCEIVRITAQGLKEAENLQNIKRELHSKGYKIPLIADIHFNSKAAEVAATFVEKVRINPGNYIPSQSKNRGLINYSESHYNRELEQIKSNLQPLINICKQHGTAIRIGVNHGSLGSRILGRYGDTVEGMVVSAVEYARICNELNFHNLVLSVKSSNTVIMAEAYRQLAYALMQENLKYPLHLGVTEAGNGLQGRMKSYVGIGAVLSYGIGDTIRVSLTENPVNEIPVASEIVKRFTDPETKTRRSLPDFPISDVQSNIVIVDNTGFALLLHEQGSYWICENETTIRRIDNSELVEVFNNESAQDCLDDLVDGKPVVINLDANEALIFIKQLRANGFLNKIFLMNPHIPVSIDDLIIDNCIYPGNLMINGLVQGLCIDTNGRDLKEVSEIGFEILQATRTRISKTEYIACPSCGRTQFNIEKRLEEVKAATSHFKGLKIAVMGCIVNGPGEMADADYGYVGAGRGKVTLYKGKQVVKHSVPEQQAVKELLEIIEKDKRSES